ncbi:MAG: 1-deoxy-D-xylulose-5-phosphate synthase [Acidimicrobiia bacterium]|nr:1-deoxy-D-xylulose-5-phosphate synthase [Acidimicrobiia bacterium]
MLLETLHSPQDLNGLSEAELRILCREIRDFLVEQIADTGGHLGPNLGVVELTVALHRVFDSPNDVIIWDTGHQAYVHKIVTGRSARFATLRQSGGLSGYPSREESRHDWVENSHASTSLSYAAGLVEAFRHRRESRRVVAVIGDGALTGGMAYEALNQIAHRELDLTIVLNDNGHSYSPTVGGLQRHLAQLRIDPLYQRAKRDVTEVLQRFSRPGDYLASGIQRIKGSIREFVTASTIFDTLGFAYSGPIDGHDIEQVELALAHASALEGPSVVHLVTTKGMGYPPAERDQRDHYHGVGKFDPATGLPRSEGSGVAWTDVFGRALLDEARTQPEIVGITAAMQASVGLDPLASAYPDRVYDVGIAEQHAVTFAAGLALGGMRPVVAIYTTFMNRAVDQVLLDVGLHRLPVTFVCDRAGVTGNDGPSHHGIFDIGLFREVPGLVIAAPATATELRDLLHTALRHDGPFLIRFPKGTTSATELASPRVIPIGEWEIEEAPGGVLLVGVGNMVDVAQKAAAILEEGGIPASVANARFVKPLDARLGAVASRHRLLCTIEDHELQGGFGSAVLEALSDAALDVPVERCAVPEQFLTHGSVATLHERCGLTPDQVAARVKARWTHLISGQD